MSSFETVNVVTIDKDRTRKTSKYVLKYESLRRLLEPIRDKEVAIISVVGECRQGKSFLLNYMARFLIDQINWFSKINIDAKLEGFEWKTEDKSQTKGFWLSQPFRVIKSDGKELYVLLMDTQGLYDRYSSERDRSTIMGFSSLISSCVIFNVFNELKSKNFEPLDCCIKSGINTIGKNNDVTNLFQKLIFLIRDWQFVKKLKYGSKGGMQYLDKQLTETDSMSAESVNVRQNIKKCFEDITCYLMPYIGDGKDREDFDGRVSQLSDNFVYKIKDFITIHLNPDEISPKMSGKTPVTGEDLFQYFQMYIEMFNESEGPNVERMLTKFINNYESAARSGNITKMNGLKNTMVSYVDEIDGYYCQKMEAILEENVYLNKDQFKQLEEKCMLDTEKFYQEKLKNLPIEDSFNLNVKKRMKESKNRFKAKNQIKCENIVNNTENSFENAINEYKRNMSEAIDIIHSVDGLEKHHQNLIRRLYQDLYNNCVFKAPYFINEYNKKFKEDIQIFYGKFVENLNSRIAGTHQKYKFAMGRAINHYNEGMIHTWINSGELSELKRTEISNRKSALELFDSKFDANERDFDRLFRSYREDLRALFEERFDEFFERMEKTQKSGERAVKDMIRNSLDSFTIQMEETLPQVTNEDEFVVKCRELKDRSVTQFRESAYLSPISDRSLIKASIKEFEDKVDEKTSEYRKKQKQKKEQTKIRNRLKSNKCAAKYIEEYRLQMNQCLNTIRSEKHFLHQHNHLLECILEKTRQSNEFGNKKLIAQLSHIETEVAKIFTANIGLVRERLGIFDKTCQNIFEQSKCQYIKKMESLFRDDKFYSISEVCDFQNKVKTDTITHFFDEIRTNGIKSQSIVDKSINHLNELFDQILVKYFQKNAENRRLYETRLNDKYKEFLKKYETDMESQLKFLLIMEDFITKHNQIKDQIMKNFTKETLQTCKFIDDTLFDEYRMDLQRDINTKSTKFRIKLRDKTSNIVEIYQGQLPALQETYLQGMEDKLKSDDLLTDESLKDMHRKISGQVIGS